MPDLYLTVDLEPDCPPYIEGWRGMEEGAPGLLSLLREMGHKATFFTTGQTAQRFPEIMDTVTEDGHEVACHGHTHRSFARMSWNEAEEELTRSTGVLRAWGPVTAFRAPYLNFPEAFLPILEALGYRQDASRSRYKPMHWGPPSPSSLKRIPASVTSSFLRLPSLVRNPVLAKLEDPIVLFVHPWEFVDLQAAPVPWDSRLGTGPQALRSLRDVLGFFQERGTGARKISEFRA